MFVSMKGKVIGKYIDQMDVSENVDIQILDKFTLHHNVETKTAKY